MLQPLVCRLMYILQVYLVSLDFPAVKHKVSIFLNIPLKVQQLSPKTRRPFAIQKLDFSPHSDSSQRLLHARKDPVQKKVVFESNRCR